MSQRRKDLLFLSIAIAVFAVLFVACEPVDTNYPVQQQGTVDLRGDSITWNTYYNGGLPSPQTSGQWLPGDHVDGSPWGGTPANVAVPEELRAGNVDILVWALGLNEILKEGDWTDRHQLIWYDILVQHVPNETCVVVVKPWILPSGYSARSPESIEALRTFIDTLVAENANISSVDWKPILEANPHFAASDGTHLEKGSGGAKARDDMYREGINSCP